MWLFSDVSCTVIRIAENVLTTIRQCVRESEQRFEVGGILLGKRIGRELQIEAATVPLNFQDCRRGSFRLDGEEATQCCRRLMEHSPELCVAGLYSGEPLVCRPVWKKCGCSCNAERAEPLVPYLRTGRAGKNEKWRTL